MKSVTIYLSWSGDLGRRVVEVLHQELPMLSPEIRAWTSESDLTPGMRWLDQTGKIIRQSNFAVVCVTEESKRSSWLLYEVGLMVGVRVRVVLLLVGIEPSELDGPLAQFQAIRSDAQSFRLLADLLLGGRSEVSEGSAVAWAKGVEAKVSQLIRRVPKKSPERRQQLLAQISEAAATKNLDQLQSLLGAADTEGLADVTLVRALLNAFHELRDNRAIIDVFERLRDVVAHDTDALSRYTWALVRSGQSSRAIEILEQAKVGGRADAEATAVLARAYKDRWGEQEARGETANARASLSKAAATYVEGFRQCPDDYSLGLNAVQLLHLLGDPNSISLRNELLPRVQSLVENAARRSSGDYWATASLLDLAVVRGSQAEARRLADELIRRAVPWQIETTQQSLRLIARTKGIGGQEAQWLLELVASLEEARKPNG